MILLLINLLQSEQRRISWVVIVAAALVLVAGVSLVVYFYRRYKRIEKEAEDDWDASRGLFVNFARAEKKSDAVESVASIEASEPEIQQPPIIQGTRELASEPVARATESETAPEPPIVEAIPPTPPPKEARATEIFASPAPAQPSSQPEAPSEVTAFDDDVWADLEVGEHPAITAETVAQNEPPRVSRVESSSHREPFEPPRIDPIRHREPFEPPRIEPLSPRQQAETRALHSQAPPAEPINKPSERHTSLFGSRITLAGSPSDAKRSDKAETLEFAAPAVPARQDVEPSVASRTAYKSRLAPAGSVLGLPSEASSQPLILGKPARPTEETGIGALTNYGKDLGPKGGRAGTVVLLLVLALLAGAAAVYVFVPSVHSRTNALVARIRGVDARTAEAASKPKAQVIPSFRPEVNKNMVIARGAVDNISDEPLENLEIEVSLQPGGDAPPEVRRIPVTPSPLPPNERGNFEFEYDGKRDTGFAGYKITRLFSNGTEVKFKSPLQK